MYYEERVIEGVLSWRGSPDGEWTPMTTRQLTDEIIFLRGEIEALAARAPRQ